MNKGKALKSIRHILGYSQQEMADEILFSRGYLRDLENMGVNVTDNVKNEYARVLGVTVEELECYLENYEEDTPIDMFQHYMDVIN